MLSSTSYNLKILPGAEQLLRAAPPAQGPVCSKPQGCLCWLLHGGPTWSCDLPQWPFGFLGTGAGHSPLNQLRTSSREMLALLMCAQTCPTAGRAELEQTLQDAAPASSPNLHTDLLLPHKVSVAIIQHSPGDPKLSSSISPPPPRPCGGSFCFSSCCGNHHPPNLCFLPLPRFCLRALIPLKTPCYSLQLGHPSSQQSLGCPGLAGSLKPELLVLCNT